MAGKTHWAGKQVFLLVVLCRGTRRRSKTRMEKEIELHQKSCMKKVVHGGNYGLFSSFFWGSAFVFRLPLSVANATVFSPIPQQTWWKPAGFRRSQQHLALYYKLHGSRGWWWQSYRSLVFVKAPRVVEGQHEDGWGKLRKHSLFSSTALAHSKSEGGICGGGMVGVQQQQLAS